MVTAGLEPNSGPTVVFLMASPVCFLSCTLLFFPGLSLEADRDKECQSPGCTLSPPFPGLHRPSAAGLRWQ